ncbi:MAG TPA: SGNH/GDSL hydrolase family protein, partial [Gammaproteobacteria bacterium]
MKEALKNLAMVSVPSLALVLLVLEVVFRTAIPAAARPQAFFDATTSIWKLDRSVQAEGLATIGKLAQQRARWRINNEGWNSPIDYATEKSRSRVAVIGDSYVEALQVDIERSYPNLLASELGSAWEVYAFGVSGAPLSQYLHMARYVVARFSPDVLVLNLVHNDFTESYADTPEGSGGV